MPDLLPNVVYKQVPYATMSQKGWQYHDRLAGAKACIAANHRPSRHAPVSQWARRGALVGLYKRLNGRWELIFVAHHDLSRDERIELLRLIKE